MQRLHEVLNMTIEELLARDPASATILGQYRIDLCRCYPLALRAAARVAGADPNEVAGELIFAAVAAAPPVMLALLRG